MNECLLVCSVIFGAYVLATVVRGILPTEGC